MGLHGEESLLTREHTMEWDAGAFMRIAIGVFFLLFGAGVAYSLFRLSAVLSRMNDMLGTVDKELGPLLTRVEATLDGVNSELDKVDQITGSVAGVAKVAEQATVAVQGAVSKPIRRAAGVATGIKTACSTFLSGKEPLRDKGKEE
jgi:hypothetical protein